MLPEIRKASTVQERYGPAMEVKEDFIADMYLAALVNWRMDQNGCDEETARKIERDHIAYFAGYFSPETRRRVESLFCACHPFFGPMGEETEGERAKRALHKGLNTVQQWCIDAGIEHHVTAQKLKHLANIKTEEELRSKPPKFQYPTFKEADAPWLSETLSKLSLPPPKRPQKKRSNSGGSPPDYPSVNFTRMVGVPGVYSARIGGERYRALARRDADGVGWLWFWIGCHAEYDRVLGNLQITGLPPLVEGIPKRGNHG